MSKPRTYPKGYSFLQPIDRRGIARGIHNPQACTGFIHVRPGRMAVADGHAMFIGPEPDDYDIPNVELPRHSANVMSELLMHTLAARPLGPDAIPFDCVSVSAAEDDNQHVPCVQTQWSKMRARYWRVAEGFARKFRGTTVVHFTYLTLFQSGENFLIVMDVV